jgi:hypothetical protein
MDLLHNLSFGALISATDPVRPRVLKLGRPRDTLTEDCVVRSESWDRVCVCVCVCVCPSVLKWGI